MLYKITFYIAKSPYALYVEVMSKELIDNVDKSTEVK